jgi:hypothetical protein
MGMPSIEYVGVRKLQGKGGSVVVSIPRAEVRDQLDIDPEKLEKETVRATLYSDGTYEVDLSSSKH